MEDNIIMQFEKGKLKLPDREVDFSEIEWVHHPAFEGVALKYIVTSKETVGAFSYHLVKIAPNKKIGLHTHENQLETHEVVAGKGICIHNGKSLTYETGTLSIFPKNIPHEIRASEEGLYLFAKFMPALC